MLFDLRGRGRRSTIKVIYVTLAILMGGGLVLFGIGGATNGGLLDAITDGSSGGGDNTYAKRVEDARKVAQTRPNDPAAWSALARAYFLDASAGDKFDQSKQEFTDSGKAELNQSAGAWEKHLTLAGDKPNAQVASLMVQAYTALNKLDKATDATEVIATARPSTGTYSNLATYAYAANQTRRGDLAAAKAVELAPKDQQKDIKSQLKSIKDQAAQQALQDAQPSATAALPGG